MNSSRWLVLVSLVVLVAAPADARRDRPGRRAQEKPLVHPTEPIPAGTAGGAAADPSTDGCDHPLLMSVLWTQTSAERLAACEQVYAVARRVLDEALAPGADPREAMSVTTTRPPADAAPAIIVDVDETVLDNVAFEGEMVLRGVREFDPVAWDAFVQRADAPAVPGALAFARHAAERGVVIYYVTNREASQEEATRRNLAALGFPIDARADVVLCKGEIGGGSDKRLRREHVALSHRILLIIGDDLNDFVSAQGLSLALREREAVARRSRWGSTWFMLPNPMYGSWDQAIASKGPRCTPLEGIGP